jgi:hypothetical protein
MESEKLTHLIATMTMDRYKKWWITKNKKSNRIIYTDPQILDQKSNVWRSVFLWLNIALNLKRWS